MRNVKRWENLINIFLFQVVVYGILFSVEIISTKGKINIGNKVSMTFIYHFLVLTGDS